MSVATVNECAGLSDVVVVIIVDPQNPVGGDDDGGGDDPESPPSNPSNVADFGGCGKSQKRHPGAETENRRGEQEEKGGKTQKTSAAVAQKTSSFT